MLNPRTLWEQWRNNNSNNNTNNSRISTPRFKLRRRRLLMEDDDVVASSEETNHDERGGSQQPPEEPPQSQSNTPSTGRMEPPPSPIPNESNDSLIDATVTPQMSSSDTCLHGPNNHARHHRNYCNGGTNRSNNGPSGGLDDTIAYSLTPPVSSPFPLIVSAKRLATDIRSQHGQKRKRRRIRQMLQDQTNQHLILPMRWRDVNHTNGTTTASIAPTQSRCMYADYVDSNSDDDERWMLVDKRWKRDLTNLTPMERTQYYWEICYGTYIPTADRDAVQPSWSAQRLPPTKSCLSSTKKPRRRNSLPASMLKHDSPSAGLLPTLLPSTMQHLQTPILPDAHEEEVAMPSTAATGTARKSRMVQFGALFAAEFQKDEPTASAIKHLADEDARRRYRPHDDDDDDPSFQEQNHKTQVTKDNSKILAAWESDFPKDDEDDDSATKRKRRRSSGTFSPLLLTPEDQDDDASLDMDEVFDEIPNQERRNHRNRDDVFGTNHDDDLS